MHIQFDNATVLRQMIQACGMGGTISVSGVYGGYIDKFPYGTVFGKGLTLKGGQCNVRKYMPDLLRAIETGDINPPEIITHRASLEKAPEMYELVEKEKNTCVKVVMKP